MVVVIVWKPVLLFFKRKLNVKLKILLKSIQTRSEKDKFATFGGQLILLLSYLTLRNTHNLGKTNKEMKRTHNYIQMSIDCEKCVNICFYLKMFESNYHSILFLFFSSFFLNDPSYVVHCKTWPEFRKITLRLNTLCIIYWDSGEGETDNF